MFDQELEQLIEEVKRLIEEGYTIQELQEEVLELLQQYNEEVQRRIEEEIFAILDEVPPDILVGPALSERLYHHAREVAAITGKLLTEHIRSQETIRELAMKLYEGYGFRDREVLQVKKELPKYLQRELENPRAVQRLMKQVNKLKTLPLRAAYTQLVEAIEKMEKQALERAIEVALEERARYYALRIAQTEIFRASNWERAKEYLEDEQITLVKFEMSTYHPKVDICDFYARLDVGYGPGVVPKKEMRTLPLHPFCRCRYIPYSPPPHKKEKIKKIQPMPFDEAARKTMERFSEYEQRQILGSRQKLAEWKAGGVNIEAIFNRLRPKYPIRRYIDVLGSTMKSKEGVSSDIKQMLEEIRSKNKLTKNKVVVGELSNEIIEFLKNRNVPIHTKEIYVNHKGLSHLARDSKRKRGAGLDEEDILRIPEILKNPSAIFFEKSKQKFNLLYCDDKSKKCIKLVVNTKFQKKKDKMTLVTTAGYINPSDMKNPDFELIFGDWKF